MSVTRPKIVLDGRLGLQSPRRAAGEYAYRLITELGFLSRPYDLLIIGDLTADPEIFKRMRFIHSVDLLITPNDWVWEQTAFPQAAKGAAFLHGLNGVLPIATRIPKIVTVHDLAEWHRGRDFDEPVAVSQRPGRTYRMSNLRRNVEKGEAVLTFTDQLKAEMGEIFGLKSLSHVHVTPLAPTVPITDPVFPKEQMVLMTASRNPGRNLAGMLDTFAQIPDKSWRLMILAEDREAAQAAQVLANRMGLGERAEVRPAADTEAATAIFQRAAAYLHLPLYEEMSLDVLNAMASGCPVVGSRTGWMAELMGEGAPLADARSAEQAAKTLLSVLQNPDFQAALACNNQKRVRSLTWKSTAQQTHQIYLQLLESRRLL